MKASAEWTGRGCAPGQESCEPHSFPLAVHMPSRALEWSHVELLMCHPVGSLTPLRPTTQAPRHVSESPRGSQLSAHVVVTAVEPLYETVLISQWGQFSSNGVRNTFFSHKNMNSPKLKHHQERVSGREPRGFHSWGRGGLKGALAAGAWRPGMPQNILQGPGWPQMSVVPG